MKYILSCMSLFTILGLSADRRNELPSLPATVTSKIPPKTPPLPSINEEIVALEKKLEALGSSVQPALKRKEILERLADMYEGIGKQDEALKVLQKLAVIKGIDQHYKDQVLARIGRHYDNKFKQTKNNADHRLAIQHYLAITTNPNARAEADLVVGRAYLQGTYPGEPKNLIQAEEHLKRAAGQTGNQRARYEAHIYLADLAFEKGEEQQALALYGIVPQDDPSYSLAQAKIGIAQAKIGIAKLKQAHQLKGDDPHRKVLIIQAQQHLTKSETGLSDASISRYDQGLGAYYLGEYYAQHNNWKKALLYYDKASKADDPLLRYKAILQLAINLQLKAPQLAGAYFKQYFESPKPVTLDEAVYRNSRIPIAIELAKIYFDGIGVRSNEQKAFEYLQWAIDNIDLSLRMKTMGGISGSNMILKRALGALLASRIDQLLKDKPNAIIGLSQKKRDEIVQAKDKARRHSLIGAYVLRDDMVGIIDNIFKKLRGFVNQQAELEDAIYELEG